MHKQGARPHPATIMLLLAPATALTFRRTAPCATAYLRVGATAICRFQCQKYAHAQAGCNGTGNSTHFLDNCAWHHGLPMQGVRWTNTVRLPARPRRRETSQTPASATPLAPQISAGAATHSPDPLRTSPCAGRRAFRLTASRLAPCGSCCGGSPHCALGPCCSP